MKVIEKYILGEFLKLLAVAISGFIILFIMVDLFENMDDLVKHRVPVASSALYFACKVPFIVGQVAPIAVLLSVLMALGVLSRHNEITAMKAGGVRLLKAFAPLLAAGLAISVLVMIMNEALTPRALARADSISGLWFNGLEGNYGKEGLWVRTPAGIFNVREMDLGKGELHGLTAYEIEKPFAVKRRIHARTAAWKDGRWTAERAEVWDFARGAEVHDASGFELTGFYPPEELTNLESRRRNMNFVELRRYIRNLEEEGYDATKYTVDLYGKLTFPLVNFIMVLVGIPFALKTGRHSGMAAGVGLSVVIAFSFWIVFAVARSLSLTGVLPPIVAAVFPGALFAAIGALMYGHVKE